jgi:hypothetical protein
MSYAFYCALLIIGWVLGMGHASLICSNQVDSVAATLKNTKGSPGSDMVLRYQLESVAGCAWAIRLWLQPWKWSRAVKP